MSETDHKLVIVNASDGEELRRAVDALHKYIADHCRDLIVPLEYLGPPSLNGLRNWQREALIEHSRAVYDGLAARAEMIAFQETMNAAAAACVQSREVFGKLAVAFRAIGRRSKGWRRDVRRMKAAGIDPGQAPLRKTWEREARRELAKQAKVAVPGKWLP